MPIKMSGMGLLNPVTSLKEKHLSSQRVITELIRAMMGRRAFFNDNQILTLGEERRDGKKYQEVANKTKLKGLVRDLNGTDRRLILRAKITGAWTSIRGTTVSGTVFSATEFWDFLCKRYNVSPLILQSHYDGCVTVFGVAYALRCNTDSLVIVRHKEIRDKILYLSQHAFTSASVCAKPLIHQGCTRSEQEIRQGSDKDKEMRGDVMIRGLLDRHVEAIIDVKLGDADADSYK